MGTGDRSSGLKRGTEGPEMPELAIRTSTVEVLCWSLIVETAAASESLDETSATMGVMMLLGTVAATVLRDSSRRPRMKTLRAPLRARARAM